MSIEKENFPNPLKEERNTIIENAESFDVLYEVIRTMGEIRGAQKNSSSEEIIKVIERVRHGHRQIDFVTRSYRIRDVVERLLESDKVFTRNILRVVGQKSSSPTGFLKSQQIFNNLTPIKISGLVPDFSFYESMESAATRLVTSFTLKRRAQSLLNTMRFQSMRPRGKRTPSCHSRFPIQ